MSEHGKKTSIYLGDPIQRVKQRLREQDSPMTLSARLNQITHRYMEFVVNATTPEFTPRELKEIQINLEGLDITPSAIRSLDSLIVNDNIAARIEGLSIIERLTLLERLEL